MERVCYQVNLQRALGGGEIYTRFLTAALARLGWRTVLLAARGASFWDGLQVAAERIEIDGEEHLKSVLPSGRAWVVTHTVASEPLARWLAERHRLTGFAHMPLYDREPRGLRFYHRVFGVSRHVIDSGRAKGLTNLHPDPLYGVADLGPRGPAMPIVASSPYDWDRRKVRDRLLGAIERVSPALFHSAIPFERKHGALTLGIVSRLTPIKQFPALFRVLAPTLAQRGDVRLEIFGAGGYASVRELRHALGPCRDRVRFWGHQSDVGTVYGRLDYVLSGLPEKEALGLNLIEAQACGTPVLAVRAPPFIETVSDGRTGHLYADPRRDGGAEFAALLDRLAAGPRLDPREDRAHLERFGEEAFRQRLALAIATLA